MVLTPQNRCPDLKFLTADGLTSSKQVPKTLKFLTADGLTPQNMCPDPEISNY